MPNATEARAVDPTRTAVLRRRYAQHYRAMWRRINRAINEYIDGVDFSQPLPLRMIAFNRFVDSLLQREFGQAENDRERGVRAMALAAYMRGITQANAEVEEDMPPATQAIYQPEHDNAIGALILLLSTQLMGVRTSLTGQLLQRYQQANGANDAKASLSDRIQKAGRTPTDTLAGDGIVRGYNDALLNAYEAAGVNFVGAVPEQKSFWQTMEDDFVCFPAGTNVETINGPMPIQNISVGDLIKTRTGYKPALATMKRDYQGQMVIVKAGNKSIVSTANHPYWTLEKGWLNGIDVERGYTLQSFDNELIKVDSVIDFSIGDPDNMPSPIIKILGFLSSAKSISVYNIEVADDNEYYADGILVHNCSYCHQMSQEKDNGYGPGIYTIAQARGLIPAHPRCRCRWRAMPKDFERSQGYAATATSPKWGTWRAPKEIGSDPRLWLYRGGGRKPVKKGE